MFFFGKKKADAVTDLGWLGTDLHSHLLPGIDDGVQDMVTSLEMINGLKALGFKKLVPRRIYYGKCIPIRRKSFFQKKKP